MRFESGRDRWQGHRRPAGKFVVAWIVTMPAAALMAALAGYVGRLIL